MNIKTDFPDNMFFAVKNKLWSTLKNCSEKIMVVWDARKDAGEKVLFLFSINGTKSYCALAEMSGPWNPNDHVDGWKDSGKASVG